MLNNIGILLDRGYSCLCARVFDVLYVVGIIFTLLGNMKVFLMMAQEIAKAGPESKALKQEIEWLYDCLSNDKAVISLFKK